LQQKLPFKESKKLIISLYDYTEAWPQHYIKAGYPVICWDKKVEGCILEGFATLLMMIEETGLQPYGLITAPPCDDFAGSGAQWWPAKDAELPASGDCWNDVEYHKAFVLLVLHLVDLFPLLKFWALENPVGRIEKLVPELKPFRKMMFNPCDYGDPYTKKTILWGNFNTELIKTPVEPEFVIWAGKKFPKLFTGTGGKSEKSKAKRSITPPGFSKAFFTANQ